MDRTVDAFKRDLTQLRTGRATPALVENMEVDYYGTMTPLKQIASISAPDARAIMIQPWDSAALREIEKTLMTSEMGFNPSNDGATITVPISEVIRVFNVFEPGTMGNILTGETVGTLITGRD